MRGAQIDRARAIFVHASSTANPATAAPFWEAWKSFEVRHGNEDTFREMLRIKRWAGGGGGTGGAPGGTYGIRGRSGEVVQGWAAQQCAYRLC
jgi:hypothetical protein